MQVTAVRTLARREPQSNSCRQRAAPRPLCPTEKLPTTCHTATIVSPSSPLILPPPPFRQALHPGRLIPTPLTPTPPTLPDPTPPHPNYNPNCACPSVLCDLPSLPIMQNPFEATAQPAASSNHRKFYILLVGPILRALTLLVWYAGTGNPFTGPQLPVPPAPASRGLRSAPPARAG